jgi:hypothetical protein
MKNIALVLFAGILAACSGEEWHCKIDGKSLYSVSSSGKLGGAGKGCTCDQIRSFERRTFGSVDEGALNSDFGC